MREAAERRQQLELEHEQALAVLNAKQQEIDLLQKVRELRLLNTHSTRGLSFVACPACARVMGQRAFVEHRCDTYSPAKVKVASKTVLQIESTE